VGPVDAPAQELGGTAVARQRDERAHDRVENQ
jgi:hypothetical protein